MTLAPRMLALALPVFFWSCAGHQGMAPAKLSPAPLLGAGQALPLVYDVENRGASFAPVVPSFEQSPSNRILPDPFRSLEGSVELSFAAWSRRRAEIEASIEKYEIGPKPGAADVDVAASLSHDTVVVVVTRKSNHRSLTLRSPVYLPSGSGPFPAVIGMNSGSGSLPGDIFTSRNIARVAFMHNQVTSMSMRGSPDHGKDPYFVLYPEYSAGTDSSNAGQYSAWSWGVSRLIDGLQLLARKGLLPIDTRHLAVTGCSYAGKMALFSGALDERIALTIAQESGGGGMPAWRTSQAIGDPRGGVEKIDNTSGQWFIQGMKTRFAGDNVYKLPHDHHELMAMVAPRALLATNNIDYVWLSSPSAYVSARAAQETYRDLGIGDRFGFVIDAGHGHCQVPASQRPAIEAFVDRFLLGRDVATDAQVYTNPDFDYQGWMPWSLRRDISVLVAQKKLTADQAAGLSNELEAALSSIATGETTPALNRLDALANQVTRLVKTGALTADQGAALIARVNSTRTRLGA